MPFAWGNLCVFITAALYLVNVYGNVYGASALASNGIARYTFSAMFPLFSQKVGYSTYRARCTVLTEAQTDVRKTWRGMGGKPIGIHLDIIASYSVGILQIWRKNSC